MLRYIFKIVSFLLGVFLIIDILIVIRVLLNYGSGELEYENINRTVIVFGSLTVMLYVIKIFLKDKMK